jgi:hypothetical protein
VNFLDVFRRSPIFTRNVDNNVSTFNHVQIIRVEFVIVPPFVVHVNCNRANVFVYCGLCCVCVLHKKNPHQTAVVEAHAIQQG